MPGRKYMRANAEAGFTLVELIIVMVILGILVTLGTGVYRNHVNSAYDRSARANLVESNAAADELFQQDRRFGDSSTVAIQLAALRPERRYYAMPDNKSDIDTDAKRLQGPQDKPSIYVRSTPDTGDESDTGQVTLCTESRSTKVFCLRSSEEVGLRLETNGTERTAQVRTRADSFARALVIADGTEEAGNAPNCTSGGSTAQPDCLIQPSLAGWTGHDQNLASSANGAPTVKLACANQGAEACPSNETGADTALFTWITSSGWRAPYAATHIPPGVRCYLDLKEITSQTDCASDNAARLTRAMLSVKNSGTDPFGSHTFVVRVTNAEGSAETSYSWTVLPGVPKVTIVPTKLSANDIPERCYKVGPNASGITTWVDESNDPTPCQGATKTFHDADHSSTTVYSRPTDDYVPAYPNRYEAVQYRHATFRWHADLETTSGDDKITQVYCQIERPRPGYSPGDPNYNAAVGLTGDLTPTQDDDWDLVTPSAAIPDANFACPGAVQDNEGRDWTGTISADTFADNANGFLPFHNNIPYRITVIAINQSGTSVKQRFIWFNSDRSPGPGSSGQNVCFSPRSGQVSGGGNAFAVPQTFIDPISGVHRVIWPQVNSSFIGPNGSPVNGRVDQYFPGPDYPASTPDGYNSTTARAGLYTLGTWPKDASSYPPNNVPRYFFVIGELGSPPYLTTTDGAPLASSSDIRGFQNQQFYIDNKDHIGVGDFSMIPDTVAPSDPKVSAVGDPPYNLTSSSRYYSVDSISLNVAEGAVDPKQCAGLSARFEYRTRYNGGGWSHGADEAWTTVPDSRQITVSAEGQTEVQVRGVDATGNYIGQLPSEASTLDSANGQLLTTYVIKLDRTAPNVPSQTGHYSYDANAQFNPTQYGATSACSKNVSDQSEWGHWTKCSVSVSPKDGEDRNLPYAAGRAHYKDTITGAINTQDNAQGVGYTWTNPSDQGESDIRFASCDYAVPENCSALNDPTHVAYDTTFPLASTTVPSGTTGPGGDDGPGAATNFDGKLSAGQMSASPHSITWGFTRPADNLSGTYRAQISYCKWGKDPVPTTPEDWQSCNPDQSPNAEEAQVSFVNGNPNEILPATTKITSSGLYSTSTYGAQVRGVDRAGNGISLTASHWSLIGNSSTLPGTGNGNTSGSYTNDPGVVPCLFATLTCSGVSFPDNTGAEPPHWPSYYNSGTYTTTGIEAGEAGHPWQTGGRGAVTNSGSGANGDTSVRISLTQEGDGYFFNFGTHSGDCNFHFRMRTDDGATLLMGFVGASDNNMEQFPNSDKQLTAVKTVWARFSIHPDRKTGPGADTSFVIQRQSPGGGVVWVDNLYLTGC